MDRPARVLRGRRLRRPNAAARALPWLEAETEREGPQAQQALRSAIADARRLMPEPEVA